MLDLARLGRLRLSPRPFGQQVIRSLVLWPNYSIAPGVRLDVEGLEHLPAGPVVFAMNHTDRYNYWPFQYELLRRTGRFTATWVKGKYYEHPLLAAFLEATNNIPAASRGYVLTRDFIAALGRAPRDDEYEVLRSWIEADARANVTTRPDHPSLTPLFTTTRSMLGRIFEPARESYAHAVNALYEAMMREFVRLNTMARDLGLDILVFPQGTRSVRLSRGHIGVAQIAAHLEVPIVPVGCSGSDKVYPGSSPWAKRGHITYRLGAPLLPAELFTLGAPSQFVPFAAETERLHQNGFQVVVDAVMQRIEHLVDEPYRFSADQVSQGVSGSARFV